MSGKSPSKIASQEETTVVGYKIFDSLSIGTTNWLSLKIITKECIEMDTPVICGACQKAVDDSGIKLDCMHQFHKACLTQLHHLKINCVMCHLDS